MVVQRQNRQVGNRRIAIAATLKRADKTVVDLTGLTVKFTMIDSEGPVKVAETSIGVTVTDATAGEVQYDLLAADVDTEGTFFAYFIVETAGALQDTFPAVKGEYKICIYAVI
jgi:hypothetical protein